MIKIGIQGGKGSANEVACVKFCERRNCKNYKIEYLISTENVLCNLNQCKIDLGVFAYQSSRGGLVQETQKAMQKFAFRKIDEIGLEIEHVLLGLENLPKNQYCKIISHPQALLEHQDFLQKKYPRAKLISAEDTALSAEKLGAREYGKDVLVIALKSCAELYNLKIIESDLPANQGYVTSFWLIEREGELEKK